MKLLKLISGERKYLEDDEAKNIIQAVHTSKFIKLRDGTLINVSSISSIGEESIPYWSQYEVYTGGGGARYIIRDGQRCYMSPENIKEIEVRKISENLLLH